MSLIVQLGIFSIWPKDWVLQQPYWLLLLLLLPAIVWRNWRRNENYYPSVQLSGTQQLGQHFFWKVYLHYALLALRAIAFTCLVVALSRPQKAVSLGAISGRGIDLVLALDLSGSMLSKDFQPDRHTVAKGLAADFVSKRPSADRVGLVVFAGQAITLCPLTMDHKAVTAMIEGTEAGKMSDRTAIGMGLAQAVNRLKNSDARSKVVILITDGVNSSGYFQPLTAAGIAKQLGVRVYTIGIGTDGMALTPFAQKSDGSYVFEMTQVEIDEDLLTQIADETGGRYFRAKSSEDLRQVYSNIDQLEKTQRKLPGGLKYSDVFYPLVMMALCFLVIELLLRQFLINPLP